MWKDNPLSDPIPESSSSRQAGGISIPPLHFDSGRQNNHPQPSNEQSSNTSHISLEKLRLFYSEKISEIKYKIEEQIRDHQDRRMHEMGELLRKNNYTKKDVKEIILKKDVEYDQLLDEFYEARLMDEESKINLIATFGQSVTVTGLIQIINDLMKRLSEKSSQKESSRQEKRLKEITLNRTGGSRRGGWSKKMEQEFDNTIDTLDTQNDIVAEKLRRIIERRRGNVPSSSKRSAKKVIEKGVDNNANQRLPTFTNLNLLNTQGDNAGLDQEQNPILAKIFFQIKRIRSEISQLKGKLDDHQVVDKTINSLQRQYQSARDKVDLLQHQIQTLTKQLTYTNKNNNSVHHNISHKNDEETQWQLEQAMEKIVKLEEHIDEVTDNFNHEMERLQERIDSKDKKIKQLTEAINTIQLVGSERQEGEFENNVSQSVDELMEEIDRLNNELAKADLEIKGYQLQIMRMNKVIEDKDKKIEQVVERKQIQQEFSQVKDDNDLVREIKQKCEDMASENQKAIEGLDRQRQNKEERIKSIYNKAAQKSSRTNQSKQSKDKERERNYSEYEQSRIKNIRTEMDEGYMIQELNHKIHKKIEELKDEKEKNNFLQAEALELKEQILLLRAKCQKYCNRIEYLQTYEEMEAGKLRQKRNKSRINTISSIIDSYNPAQKVEMVDCLCLLIKLLSDSVEDEAVVERCENLLRRADSSLGESSISEQKHLERLFGEQREFRTDKVDSIPTVEYKRGVKNKRNPV